MVTTSIVGDIFVVHDPSAELQTVVGGQQTLDWVAIYQLLRGSFGDHYDFMSCYLDVASGMINIGSASASIYNDASGIGRWTATNGFNERPTWGTNKLSHWVYHSTNLASIPLTTVLHEIGHRWLAYVNYADTNPGPAQRLLHDDWIWNPGQQGVHWGRWLDNQNSCMDYDQAEWADNGNGTFNRIDRDPTVAAQDDWFGYAPLDQYLMGLIPAVQVPSFKIIRSPTPALSEVGPMNVPTGPYTPNPSALTITIAQIINQRSDEPAPFSGPRNPPHFSSQRLFHEAVVVVTKNTTTAGTFIPGTDDLRKRAGPKFRRATSGRAMIDSSLLRSNYASLYIKDNSADTGAATSSGQFWLSPDMWIRNADDGGTADQPTIRGSNNWIYVRVRNRSSQAYSNVTVNVYLANFAGTEFLYPVDWNPAGLLGSALLPNVPAASGGVDGEAIAKIEWTAATIPPAAGWHPCLLGEVIPMEVDPAGLHHVWENRKLAQRNLTIIDPPGTGGGPGTAPGFMFAYPFTVGHELREARMSKLRIQAERRSQRLRLFLDPGGLVEGIAENGAKLSWDIPLGAGKVPTDGDVSAISLEQESPTEEDGHRPPFGCLGALFRLMPPTAPTGLSGHRLKALRPVLLNGLPLLELTGSRASSVVLRLPPGSRSTLRLFGVAPSERVSGLYHLSEEVDGKVVGGVSLRVGG
jgi:hypothetical protein